MEKRLAAIEAGARTPPAPPSVALTKPLPPASAEPVRSVKIEPVAAVPAIKPTARPSFTKWSPYAQQLRAQVRSAYEKVIKEFPDTPEAADAYLGLAAMAEEDEDWIAAAKAYERLLTEFPKSASAPEAQFRLAGVLFSQGAWSDARRAYLLAADTYPKHALAIPALISAADCSAKNGDITEALRDYKGIERSQQGSNFSMTVRLKTAELLLKGKRFAEAVEAFKSVLPDLPDLRRPDVEMQLALAQLKAGQSEAARTTLLALLPRATVEPLAWNVHWHLAMAYEEEEKPLDAGRAFVQLADKFPGSAQVLDARMHAAHAFLAAEMADHASEQIEAVLVGVKGCAPEVRAKMEPQALYTAAKAAQQAGDIVKANARLAALRQNYPDHTLVLDADFAQANALVEGGRVDEAIALLRQVVRRYPDSPRATALVMRIAELQERSGKSSKGITVYSELLNIGGDADKNAHFKLRRGLLLQEVSRDEEAAEIFRALVADVNTPKAVASLACYQNALIDQRAGRLPDAIGGYEKFLDSGTGSSSLTGIDISGLLEDAKWKISKLKWLSTQTRETPQTAKTKAQTL